MDNSRRYGWKPDLPDHRDFTYALHGSELEKKLPESIDLRSKCSPVEDQLDLGSCTAQALVGNIEFLEYGSPRTDMSRLFLYYNEREIEGSASIDSGAQIRTGIKSLASKGTCKEILWPYDVKKFAKKPPIGCYVEGERHKITKYVRLNRLQEMLQCLADGYPFVFGFTVYDYFESEGMAKTGVLDLPGPTERVLGGHAVMAVGYNQKKKMLLVRNSWGKKWGLDGYFLMPFGYVTNRDLSDDFWTIRK